jgi:hypothetical protein
MPIASIPVKSRCRRLPQTAIFTASYTVLQLAPKTNSVSRQLNRLAPPGKNHWKLWVVRSLPRAHRNCFQCTPRFPQISASSVLLPNPRAEHADIDEQPGYRDSGNPCHTASKWVDSRHEIEPIHLSRSSMKLASELRRKRNWRDDRAHSR